MSQFEIKLKHDHGFFTLYVVARNATAARHMVREYEGCPDRAIRSVRRIGHDAG